LHHIALPGGPGDFTPYQAPEYVGEQLSPFGDLEIFNARGYRTGGGRRAVLCRGHEIPRWHTQVIAQRRMEAGG
jgi:hypothetical protein